jgi:hypothetical protein
MVSKTTEDLAVLALALLDSGSVDELRLLLEGATRSGPLHNAPSTGLPLVAAWCSVGVRPQLNEWRLPGFPHGGTAQKWLVNSTVLHSTYRMSGAPLENVRDWIAENTDSLLAARTCMIYPTIAKQWQELASDEPSVDRSSEVMPAETTRTEHIRWLHALLVTQSAIRITNERSIRRIIHLAREAGVTQRDVAESLQRPQTYVFRQLQQIDADPQSIAMTPRELHDHYLAGDINRRELLELLAAYRYERGAHPEDAPDWGYVAGSYDELVQLAAEGSLSDDELDVILTGVSAMASLDA